MDDKESLTPNRFLSALGRKSPNPERRQLWLFFSTSEPHHQNPSVSIFLQGGKAGGDGFCRDRLRGCSGQHKGGLEFEVFFTTSHVAAAVTGGYLARGG
ncbi:unnamed protein product [Sphagnum jensenii]|uniref:Uncharacterized protein n=1 Tax=Sphagnum jensenii TaxID=128206 RepID=A0ABP0WIE5_9BRYO